MVKYGFTYNITKHGKKIERAEAKPEFKTKSEAKIWIEKNKWLKGTNPRIIKINMKNK